MVLQGEDATLALAHRAAQCLPAEPLVIYLEGDLGAGKTSFARGMLQGMGEAGPVRSPTYGLVAEYNTPAGLVIHVDLYRLREPGELLALGLTDYVADSRLWLIEWPERAAGRGLPAADVRLCIDVAPAGRSVRFVPVTERGRRWAGKLSADHGS